MHCLKEVVIKRTYDGYQTEIQTVYGQLEKTLGVPIKPAPDEWDRLYNVDFSIEVNGKYIGIQIKPVTFEFTFENHKWKEMHEASRIRFKGKYGGDVFIVYSVREGDSKVIKNPMIVDDIEKELARLRA